MLYDENDVLGFLSDFDDLGIDISAKDAEGAATYLNRICEHHKNFYDREWSRPLERITAIAESGSAPDIQSVLDAVAAGTTHNEFAILPDFITSQFKCDLGEFAGAPAEKKLVASDGRYVLLDNETRQPGAADLVAPFVEPETDAVVEFGGGWGKNLAGILGALGRRDIVYINCEPSVSGRTASEALFSHLGEAEHRSREFRFEAPETDFLGRFSNVLAFTYAAIEQVPFVHYSFLENIMGAAARVTLVHVEPFGWQRFTNITCFVIGRFLGEGLGHVRDRHHARHVFRFSDPYFHDNAASWAIAGLYNLNLLRLARRLVENGRGGLVHAAYDVYGNNPLNSYSLIVVRG